MDSSTHGKCERCGAINPYNLFVCHTCGARLPWAAINPPAQVIARPAAPLQEEGMGTLIGYGCGAALLPCIGFIVGLCNVSKYPRRAIACFIGTVVGFIFGFFVLAIIGAIEEASHPTANPGSEYYQSAPPPGIEPGNSLLRQ